MEDKNQGNTEFRYLVRVANTDLNGNKMILYALTKIKGVGVMFSNFLCTTAGIEKNKKTGQLSDAELKKLDEIIKNPVDFGAPSWLMNRRKDYDTGSDRHIITVDLGFTKDNDIKRLKKTKSYKGMRHARGLPVRGQRTKANFRRNKGKVAGVARKKGKSGKT